MYRLPHARPDGQRAVGLDPLELLDRLARLVPPPRLHRHRYHGVLAPHARLRRAVTARANQAVDGVVAIPPARCQGAADSERAAARVRSAAIRLWAALLARIYEVFPLICPRCGGAVRLIAFLTERAAIARILTHLGEPTVPPALAAARAPPHAAAEFDQRPARDVDQPEPVPDIDFDQSHGW